MLTKEDYQALLGSLATSAGATDDVMGIVGKMQEDFEEREAEASVLRSRDGGELPNGFDNWGAAYHDAIAQRDTMRQRYVDRFMSGTEDAEPIEPPVSENKPRTYSSLFKPKK